MMEFDWEVPLDWESREGLSKEVSPLQPATTSLLRLSEDYLKVLRWKGTYSKKEQKKKILGDDVAEVAGGSVL